MCVSAAVEAWIADQEEYNRKNSNCTLDNNHKMPKPSLCRSKSTPAMKMQDVSRNTNYMSAMLKNRRHSTLHEKKDDDQIDGILGDQPAGTCISIIP